MSTCSLIVMKNIRYILVGLILGGGFGANIGAYLSSLYNLESSILLIQKGFIVGVFTGVVPTLLVLLSSIIVKWVKSGNKDYYQQVQNSHLNTNFN